MAPTNTKITPQGLLSHGLGTHSIILGGGGVVALKSFRSGCDPIKKSKYVSHIISSCTSVHTLRL